MKYISIVTGVLVIILVLLAQAFFFVFSRRKYELLVAELNENNQ